MPLFTILLMLKCHPVLIKPNVISLATSRLLVISGKVGVRVGLGLGFQTSDRESYDLITDLRSWRMPKHVCTQFLAF